jgi:osmotically-inducible protein OsmY
MVTANPTVVDFVPPSMNAAEAPSPFFERIHRALSTNPFVPSRQVRVEAADGRVTLKGNVGSFFQKQMAQEAVRRVDGVQAIDNLLQVTWA